MKLMTRIFVKLLFLLAVVTLSQFACHENGHATGTQQERGVATTGSDQSSGTRTADSGSAAKVPKPVSPGAEARAGDHDAPALFCTDPNLLDFALDAAHNGMTHDAMQAMADSRFFSVPGPVRVKVKDSQMNSRWPKVFVEILDGDSAGQTGWIQFSELKDLR